MELARDARPYNYVQGMSCLQILSRPEQHKGRKAETFGHLKALNPVATFPLRQQAGLSYQLTWRKKSIFQDEQELLRQITEEEWKGNN